MVAKRKIPYQELIPVVQPIPQSLSTDGKIIKWILEKQCETV
jgi:hypothetical protein